MTVKELIDFLKTAPPDFPVIYQCCSDYQILEIGEIKIQHSTEKLNYGVAIKHHNRDGEFRMYEGPAEYGVDGWTGEVPLDDARLPKPVDAVILPGN